MTPTFAGIGLTVQDMGATLAFYRRLGLDLPDTPGEPHVETTLPGGVRLMFDTVDTIRSFDPHWNAPTGGHRVGLAFECPSPSDVDAQFAALTAAGYRSYLEPFDAFWGQRYATLLDPDDNPVDLFAAQG